MNHVMAALAPDVLTTIGPVPLTNTLVNTIFIDALIIFAVFMLHKHMQKIPGYFQNGIEMIVQGFYSLTETIAGKNAEKIFPWFFTFFIFILLANWSGLLPGAESVGFTPTAEEEAVVTETPVTEPIAPTLHEEGATTDDATEAHGEEEESHLVSLNRNLTSDLNATLALALISLGATHILSIRTLGVKEYLGRFFSLNPILLFVGILEIISEFTKIISLSFRLFGNIFAGEVVLATISSLFAFIFPLPFMFLEIIVGLVQALVFSMLTMVFMSVLMTSHHEDNHAKEVSH